VQRKLARVADQMTHEEARTIMRRIANDHDRLVKVAEEQLAAQEKERLAIDASPGCCPDTARTGLASFANLANNRFPSSCDNAGTHSLRAS
jgi:hypothetical protein